MIFNARLKDHHADYNSSQAIAANHIIESSRVIVRECMVHEMGKVAHKLDLVFFPLHPIWWLSLHFLIPHLAPIGAQHCSTRLHLHKYRGIGCIHYHLQLLSPVGAIYFCSKSVLYSWFCKVQRLPILTCAARFMTINTDTLIKPI